MNKKKNFKKRKKSLLFKLISLFFIISFSAFITVCLISFILGPPPLSLKQNSAIYSDTGEKIAEVSSVSGVGQQHWIPLSEIPDHVKEAIIAVEDKHFYTHHGFDYFGIIRSIFINIQAATLKAGASTITQQYARNLYLTHEKTWERKWKEAFYTLRLEMHYSKEEILEGYLNTIYFGHGAYGIEAASQYFFQKNAEDLTLAESAMLVGIPKGPTYYSPLHNEERATNRQQLILDLMYQQGKITVEEWNQAKNEKLHFQESGQIKQTQIAPYFQDTVLEEAANLLHIPQEEVRTKGYHIYTTLNKELQQELEESSQLVTTNQSELEIGAMAMDPHTGAIKALIGGKDYQQSSYNRAVTAKRMPGSTFKPILYYAALEKGFNPSTSLISKPTIFQMNQEETYQPSNFNGYYANKPITLAQAIALSDNIYAVKTFFYVGLDSFIQTARNLGITSSLPNVPSLALGTASVSVKEMTTAYSIFANGGKQVEGHTIEKIVDANGKTVFTEEAKKPKQILLEENTFVITDLLTGMFDPLLNGYTTVTGAPIINELTRAYAGKSGTTPSDSWMIGYSPSLVTSVWTGYDDNRSIEKVAELTFAKRIWAAFMEAAHQQTEEEDFIPPKNVISVPIDVETGLLATPDCPNSRHTYFKKGTEPTEYCTKHLAEDQQEKDSEKGLIQRLLDFFIR